MKKRKLFDDLVSFLPKKEMAIVTGARQTGKSTLLRQLENYCTQHGYPTLFLNLENKAILTELDKSPLSVLSYLPDTTERVVVFIDEVQYLDDPSNFLKLIYDEYGYRLKLIASGSSAFYLDEKFRDSMAGRKRIFILLTCSFEEYLEISEKSVLIEEVKRLVRDPHTRTIHLDKLRIEWEQYITFGGYPAVITESSTDEKILRLREIRDSFVKRDLLESGVSNENAFYHLFRIMAGQSGSLVNINELSVILRVKNETVKNYLHVLQKCFHITLIRPFYSNLRKELVKMPKVFLMDVGMRNCLLEDYKPPRERSDMGSLWENAFFRILVERFDLDSVRFWRTAGGNEVDFVVSTASGKHAFEVKYSNTQINHSKYNLFRRSYPEILLGFVWMEPFSEDFFSFLDR